MAVPCSHAHGRNLYAALLLEVESHRCLYRVVPLLPLFQRETVPEGARLIEWPIVLSGDVEKLKDLDYFKRFTIDPFTIDWNDEIGFAPEYLYEHGTPA